MSNRSYSLEILQVFIITLSIVAYYFIGYKIDRGQSLVLLPTYTVLFFLAYFLIRKLNSLKHIFWIGVLFRLIFLTSIPLLSQDFYRFIWDGMLLTNKINPYEFTPNMLINSTDLLSSQFSQELYDGMGELSAQHYSNYPPINQLGFYIASLIGKKSVLANIISIRVMIILFDLLIFSIGTKLLKQLELPTNRISFYFLNPLVIIELAGNLHWEGVMIFFFLSGLYFIFHENKYKWSTVFMSISVAIKLIPLILLPLLWNYLKPRKSILFGIITSFLLCFLFLPLFVLENGIDHYLKTINLWFNRFEFNGSIYNLIRQIGYEIKGYNIIRTFGKVSPFIIISIVAAFSFLRKNNTPSKVITGMLLTLSCYFFVSTTIHPWYIISLVALSMFTRYTYPILWSTVVILSYATYGNLEFKENNLLLLLQYGFVYLTLFYELLWKKSLLHHLK